MPPIPAPAGVTLQRSDAYIVTVTVDGVNLGTFDKVSGGHANSDEIKYRPGAMGDQVALGGGATLDNITVTRAYDQARDEVFLPNLIAKRGRAISSVTTQTLDANKNAFGKSITRSGVLKSISFPEPDAEANSVAMLALEISLGGSIVIQ